MSSDHAHAPAAPVPAEDASLAAPPDGQNVAIKDARLTFVFTVITISLFIGAVVLFIL